MPIPLKEKYTVYRSFANQTSTPKRGRKGSDILCLHDRENNMMIEKPTTCREFLDLIDEFLTSSCYTIDMYEGEIRTEPGKLWDVLSALRGPDGGAPQATVEAPSLQLLKHRTTAVIRGLAFPVASSGKHASILSDWTVVPNGQVCLSINEDEHFHWHVRRACEALDHGIQEVEKVTT